jgi:hypothetical protein
MSSAGIYLHVDSSYLRHAKPERTYWYIEAVPELLALASVRAERSIALRGAVSRSLLPSLNTAVLHRSAVHPTEC